MGGKSKSSSSSSSTTTTTQIDRRIGAAEGSLVLTEGSSVAIEAADVEVIEAALSEAFGFAAGAADKAGGLVGNALSLVEDANKRSLEAQAAVGELGSLKELLKTTTIIVGLGAAAFVLPRVLRS